jgi:HPt (histidine-containing phosphotransfer) domain-containing protein/PAS domain-containing protein
MNLRSLNPFKSSKSSKHLDVMVGVLGLGFMVAILVPALHLASELLGSTEALKFVGQQQHYPTVIRASLDSLHDSLVSRSDIQEPMSQLRDAIAKVQTARSQMDVQMIAGGHAAAAADLWARENEVLKPLVNYAGTPYDEKEAGGPSLTDNGRQLERNVEAAIRESRRTLPFLNAELVAIAADLESTNAQAARKLRLVMLGGLAIAATLTVMVMTLLRVRRRQQDHLLQARQQTIDILRTVKDGLFLIDRDLIIGTAYSAALETLFQRKDIAGLAFETLLKNIVSEKTLATALKFVTVLWAERTNEKLVKSINPLGEVEIHLDMGSGRFETRFLQFEFHRVRVEGKITHVLVSVSDVTARVELARELKSLQSQAQAQVETLLGILHIDPMQLGAFLSDSNSAMKMINAVLREPAREVAVFRKKLDTLFRHVHAVKGEAAALGLSSIESRAHSFEDDLNALREKTDLSGNDFVPLVIKLDDLLTHLQSVGELVARISQLQPPAPAKDHAATAVLAATAALADPVPASTPTQAPPAAAPAAVPDKSGFDLPALLKRLAARVAAENDKQATVHCEGLDLIPEYYRRIVKDIAIQTLRNAIVHGIEAPSARLAAGKAEQGQVRFLFQSQGDLGFKFIVEDDGQGLATERIKEVALARGLVSAEQAAVMGPKEVCSLLFKAGFSTVAEPTKDAGRGVGMNVVADLMQEVGGRVGVATSRGRFTRFTLSFPHTSKLADESAVA